MPPAARPEPGTVPSMIPLRSPWSHQWFSLHQWLDHQGNMVLVCSNQATEPERGHQICALMGLILCCCRLEMR